MVGGANDALYTLDTSDGTATRVGTSAAIGNTLYLAGQNTGLYTLVLP